MSKTRLSRSVWESFVSRFSGSRRLTKQARRTLRPSLKATVAAESLEQRIVLAGTPVLVSFDTGILTLTGGASADVVSVKAGTSFTDVLVNSKFLTRMNGVTNSQITTIGFVGGTGTDSLSVSGITTALNLDLTGVEKLQLNVGAAGLTTDVDSDAALILLTSTISGDFNLTTTAGGVTQTGKVLVAGGTTITAATDIILKTAGNSFGTLVLTGVNVTINEAGPTDFGATTATGNFVVTSSGAITDSDTLLISGTSTITSNGNSITFDEPLSTFGGKFTLKGTDISIINTDATDTDLGAVTATGAFTLTSTGQVTHSSGNVTVGGLADISTLLGAENITITSGSNNFGSLKLNGKDVLITEKSATNLSTTTATGILTVLSSGAITDTGVVTVALATSLTATGSAILLDSASTFTGTVFLKGTNVAITDSDAATALLAGTTATGNLKLTTTGNVTQTGVLTVAGRLSVIAVGKGITLQDAANKFGSIEVSGKDVKLREADATDLFTSTTTGLLDVESAGAITDSGQLIVATTTTLKATGKNITFDNADSTFGTTVTITSGFNVAITDDDGATALGASTTTGNLTVNTTGGAGAGVSQTGALSVTGRMTVVTTDSVAKDINLPTAANSFGSISVFGAVVTLAETGSTDLFTSSATGNFDLTSTGPVTDSGDLTVGGTTDIDAGANDITLNSALSTFTGDVLFIGKDVTVINATATGIGVTTTTGLLSITSNGAIEDHGKVIVAVGAKTTLNALGHDITIDDTTNKFGGTIGLFGDNVVLTTGAANGAVALATTKALGTFDLTVNGNITDTGVVKADGVTTIKTSTPATQDITLDSGLNSFGQLVLTGDVVTIVEFGETDLGVSTVSSLKVTSSGGIEDSGKLIVTGLAELTANGGDLTLDDTTSTFGSVKLQGLNVAIKEGDDTELAGVTTPGTFDLVTTAGVTQTAGISVGGDATVIAATTIALNQVGDTVANNFGTLDFSGTDVSIHESSDTDLEDSEAVGTLTILSTGNITGNGVVTSTGVTDLNASGNSIDLSKVGTTFGDLRLQGSTVTINDGSATKLLTLTNVTGALNLTSSGAVTQDAGGITVGGLLTVTATGDIILSDGGNNLHSLSLFGVNVDIEDNVGDIILATSTITGTFKLDSAGSVTDSDLSVLKITGVMTITAVDDITLDEADSTFTTIVLVGANIELNSYSALTLGDGNGVAITATGTLTLRTFNLGNITQTAADTISAIDDTFMSADGTLTLDPTVGVNTFEGLTDHFFSNGIEVF